MISCVVFLSQSYLNFASHDALAWLCAKTETVLILHKGEEVSNKLKPYISKVHYVEGDLKSSLRPALNKESVIMLVAECIKNHGSPRSIRIFCQQEDNVTLAALVREHFNIPGDGCSIIAGFRDKILMKTRVSNCKLGTVPKYLAVDEEALIARPEEYYNHLKALLGDKFIIKPVSAAGSFNVCVIESFSDMLNARNILLDEEYVFKYEADEFVSGKLYQCDSIVVEKEVFYCGILELGCSNFDFVQGKPLSVYPVISKHLYKKLFEFNKEVISSLGLENGAAHHEVFVRENGDLIFLEIAARVPGGLGVPYHLANGNINLIDANIYLTMGCDLRSKLSPFMRNNVISALLPVGNGIIKSLNEPSISSRYEIDWYVHEGMSVNSRSLVDAAGVLMAFNDDPVALRSDFVSLQDYVPVTCI